MRDIIDADPSAASDVSVQGVSPLQLAIAWKVDPIIINMVRKLSTNAALQWRLLLIVRMLLAGLAAALCLPPPRSAALRTIYVHVGISLQGCACNWWRKHLLCRYTKLYS